VIEPAGATVDMSHHNDGHRSTLNEHIAGRTSNDQAIRDRTDAAIYCDAGPTAQTACDTVDALP
jgi:hypothetical protein